MEHLALQRCNSIGSREQGHSEDHCGFVNNLERSGDNEV
jgi:hypothetical protein